MATSQIYSNESFEALTEQEFKSELVEELNEIAEDLVGVHKLHWTFSLYFVVIVSAIVLVFLVHSLVRLILQCRRIRQNKTHILTEEDSEDNF